MQDVLLCLLWNREEG